MDQIMRLRRRAGEEGIVDPNSGHDHEVAFVKIIEKKGTLDESHAAPGVIRARGQGQAETDKTCDQGNGWLESGHRRRSRHRTGKMRTIQADPGCSPKASRRRPGPCQGGVYAHAEQHQEEFNIYIKGEDGDQEEPASVAAEPSGPDASQEPTQ